MNTLRLYKEAYNPESVDDFVAIYDMQALLGFADPHSTCEPTSGCYFRKDVCLYHQSSNDPTRSITCSTVLGDEDRPAIFILRSDYERSCADSLHREERPY